MSFNKVLCLVIVCVCYSTNLWGLSVCLPKYTGSIRYIYSPTGTTYANRGWSVTGKECNYNTQSCKSIVVRHETHCSVAGILPSDNWEEAGRYCWLRSIGFGAHNGAYAARIGAWVLGYAYGNKSQCAQLCGEDYITWLTRNPDYERVVQVTGSFHE